MGPLDGNLAGRVHGGTVLKLCDEAAGLAALRHARRPTVTVAVDRVTFLHPVHLGEVLTLKASVNAAWNTSMEVGVRVEAENPFTGEQRHTSSAYLTMVAIDENGRPSAVAPHRAETQEAQRREREAQLRRANRLAEREQIVDERKPVG
jgi:acyl-CoA hydrolase